MRRLFPLVRSRAAARATVPRFRLRFEELEGRLAPAVLAPAQVRHGYGVDQISFGGVTGDGSGQTIAIVDAYDDPNIFNDLNKFDSAFGLPSPPSFVKATQSGIRANSSWAEEISLDVEWAHAIAPKANLLLVEAANSSFTNLLSAVDYASSYSGVSAVSMSWGGSEFAGEASLDSHFSAPGLTYVAASGDNGTVIWPAVSANVLGVGGTTLALDGSNNWQSETGWSGSGGGESAVLPEPSYQNSAQSTGLRTSPDVAYNADPNSGVYVYDSYRTHGSHWFQVGGTSAGAPQWAALVAIANQGRELAGKSALSGAADTLPAIYAQPQSNFHDITSGSNGTASAGPGYDQVTGRGTPKAQLVVASLVSWVRPAAPAAPSHATSSGTSGKSGPVAPAETVVVPVPTAPTVPAVVVGLDLSFGTGRVIQQYEGPAPTPAAPPLTPTPTVVVVAPSAIVAPPARLLTVEMGMATLQPDDVPIVPPTDGAPTIPAEQQQPAPTGAERREKAPAPNPKQQNTGIVVEEVTGDCAPIRVDQEPAVVKESSLTIGLAVMLGAGLVLAGNRKADIQRLTRRVWVGRS